MESCEVEMTAPSHIKGLKYSFSEGEINISFRGFALYPNNESLPLVSVPRVLAEILDELASGVKIIKNDQNEFYINETGVFGNYIVTIDILSQQLKTLEIPSLSLSCYFYDFL
ncbi:MAG: hypothetical protein FWG69_04790 [Oscillospiraceae bacterium]|nr:hypothetical protein [Oscillospiraceae bacterium]